MRQIRLLRECVLFSLEPGVSRGRSDAAGRPAMTLSLRRRRVSEWLSAAAVSPDGLRGSRLRSACDGAGVPGEAPGPRDVHHRAGCKCGSHADGPGPVAERRKPDEQRSRGRQGPVPVLASQDGGPVRPPQQRRWDVHGDVFQGSRTVSRRRRGGLRLSAGVRGRRHAAYGRATEEHGHGDHPRLCRHMAHVPLR